MYKYNNFWLTVISPCNLCPYEHNSHAFWKHISGFVTYSMYDFTEKISNANSVDRYWKRLYHVGIFLVSYCYTHIIKQIFLEECRFDLKDFDQFWQEMILFNFMITDKMIADIIPEYYLKSHHQSRFKQQTITLVVRGLYI